jgi:integrase
MPRLSIDKNPKLRRHRASGQGLVTLAGKDHYLGRWPAEAKDPPAAVQAEYDRLIAEWRVSGRRRPLVSVAQVPGLTVGELILRYWEHAQTYYTNARVRDNIRLALRPVRRLYEALAAAEFSPKKLKAVRDEMVRSGLSRPVVNSRVGIVKRMIKWGVADELVPAAVYHALGAVAGLAKGRTAAREPEPVRPVPDVLVDTVLPHLLPPVAALVQLQRLTGARAGELVIMRPCDLDATGGVWLFRPSHHKTEHHGKDRVIAIGPKAQLVLRPFLPADPQAFVFSPARALAERAAVLRSRRRTRVQPSQLARGAKRRRRPPGERYTVTAYRNAIYRACDRADRLARQKAENTKAETEAREPVMVPAGVGDADRLIPRWHPHQLRHTHGTLVRRRFGLEHAQVVLGHSKADVTQVYAERDLSLAVRVAAECG